MTYKTLLGQAARLSTVAAAAALSLHAHAATNTLTGWALMPANTFSDGPTSGQFNGSGAGGNLLPLLNKQPVQGFSAVLPGAASGSYLVMPDNGFGAQTNSADTLLRVYAVTPDFKTATGGTGTVSAASYSTGATLPGFNNASRVTLADPDRKLGFQIQADLNNYYGLSTNAAVDPTIKAGRLLTGADFDIEAMRKDKNGNLWFGDEFGPMLLKTDANGKVLRSEIVLPGVQSPQSPYLAGGTANLGRSNGFEGMAINQAGDTLFTLLEGTVAGDAARSLRINAFNVDREAYTGDQWLYQLDALGTNIGDMTAINDHEFLVIERNNNTATTAGAPFKKIFKIDLNKKDANGFVSKSEVVDLMNIADPDDLNGDGSATFTFPFVTIEDVLMLDSQTLLVINDNNYPGVGGRNLGSDNTEFLKIRLAEPLMAAVPEPESWALGLCGLGALGLLACRKAK
jgi:hypothetical protein